MFNTTHTLAGVVLARAGFDRWSPGAVRTSVIAANLPDIDSIAGVFGTAAYLEWHRGITHSLIAIPVLSVAVAAALYKFTGNFLRTSVIACVALASHLMLDYMNDYGVRPFLPFDGTTYYGDTLFIVDPVFDVILLGALIAGYFLPRRRQQGAACALLLSTLYVGAAMELRKLSRSYLPAGQHAVVSPRPLAPFRWSAFVDRSVSYHFLFCDNHTRICAATQIHRAQNVECPPSAVYRQQPIESSHHPTRKHSHAQNSAGATTNARRSLRPVI